MKSRVYIPHTRLTTKLSADDACSVDATDGLTTLPSVASGRLEVELHFRLVKTLTFPELLLSLPLLFADFPATKVNIDYCYSKIVSV